MSKGGGGAGGSTIIQSGQPIIINAPQNDHDLNQKIKKLVSRILEQKKAEDASKAVVVFSTDSLTHSTTSLTSSDYVKIVDCDQISHVVSLCVPCDLIYYYNYYRGRGNDSQKPQGSLGSLKLKNARGEEITGHVLQFFDFCKRQQENTGTFKDFKVNLLPKVGQDFREDDKNLAILLNTVYNVMNSDGTKPQGLSQEQSELLKKIISVFQSKNRPQLPFGKKKTRKNKTKELLNYIKNKNTS